MKTIFQTFTKRLKKWKDSAVEMILTAVAFLWIVRYVIAEIIAATLVTYGVSLIYVPASVILAGVLLWLIARNIEAYDVSEQAK